MEKGSLPLYIPTCFCSLVLIFGTLFTGLITSIRFPYTVYRGHINNLESIIMNYNNNNRRRNRNKTKKNQIPSATALRYQGPLTLNDQALAVIDCCADFPITSTAGGVINDIFTDLPSGADWTAMTAVFSEYRVLAMAIRYTPNVTGATQGALVYAPLYSIWDASNTTTPVGSYATALNYPNYKVASLNEPLFHMHKMSSVEEGTFVSVASVLLDYAFKLFATGLTVSTLYGRVAVTWHLQFRGRQ